MTLPTPPRASINPKPKKIVEDLQDFQKMQYDFFTAIQDDLANEETEFNADIEELVESEIESYNKIWAYIDTL